MKNLIAKRIHITGVVQGVGFRPFVYNLASSLGLTGWVRNTSGGVDIQVEGNRLDLSTFITSLRDEKPPLASIDEMVIDQLLPNGHTSFEILHSETIADAFQPISPDVCICPDCLEDLFTITDRRYRYPFINCTNCGPRFTIIEDIPYDRPKTTMAGFKMCPECEAEYSDPSNRRFHAQPVACPVCGPRVWLENNSDVDQQQQASAAHDQYPAALSSDLISDDDAIIETQRLLAQGKIVAIKGLGGFHLACDATNKEAVSELRRRKLRVDKPFALMMADISTIESQCYVDQFEKELLESRDRPIVVLNRRPGSSVALDVAPYQTSLGVMLPYTPLHYLLFDGRRTISDQNPLSFRPVEALVMTSGNLSEEPIAIDNQEARQRLLPLADAFLMHDRPIRTRCDDSVMRVFGSHTQPIRRSRGYAPFPVHLPWEVPPLLAAGAELKNTFCITRDRYAFMSHHIGDLQNYETLTSFEDGVAHFERLFRIRPEALVYDLHPDYLSSRYVLARALRENLPVIGVQHHHAHIAAGMAENQLSADSPVIGVAFDGIGFGEDGAIWGGEFLLCTYTGFQRLAHLAYVPLPGGDMAIRKPARTALAFLWQAGLDWDIEIPSVVELCAEERHALKSQIEHKLNAPLSSSMGRLFDAVASLAGVRQNANYEAQSAIELEALVDPGEDEAYQFAIQIPENSQNGSRPILIDPSKVISSVVSDYHERISVSKIAARFHNGVAQMVLEVCQELRTRTGTGKVVLSGGVWQNVTLLGKTVTLLRHDKFEVYFHEIVPPNDGGIALGQAVIAAHKLKI
jgi:hydrogenase maturation protein HypF